MGVGDLERLRTAGQSWLGPERGWELWYALFSRSGFTEALREQSAEDPHVVLVEPEDTVAR